jgi:hypothetical protein
LTINAMQDRSGTNSAGLLVSILLRFPEVGSVTFDPVHHSLRFTLLVRGRLDAEAFGRVRELLEDSVRAFGTLQGAEPRLLDVERTSFQRVTAIELVRDVETLTREEIAMLIELARDGFGDGLVVESDGSLVEEDLIVQEQLIDAALDDLRDSRGQQNLIAYREGGRVMVFNK